MGSNFGNFLYELRKEKGWSQAELAERLGRANRAVSKWETGETMPGTELLSPMAELFGVTVDELLKGRRNGTNETLNGFGAPNDSPPTSINGDLQQFSVGGDPLGAPRREQLTDVEEMVAGAKTLVRLGEWHKAKNVLDKAVESFPADWRTWFALAEYYTAGFTNLSDTQHYYFLDRAKKVADEAAAAQIDALYAPFAKKTTEAKAAAQAAAQRYLAERQRQSASAPPADSPPAGPRKKSKAGLWVAIIVPAAAVLLAAVIVLLIVLLPGGGCGAAETPGALEAVSSGTRRTFALDENGALWEVKKSGFTRIKSGTAFITVSAGEDYAAAIDMDGGLWAWTTGSSGNTFGQVGDGSNSSRSSPVRIKSDTKFKAVSAGGGHTLAVDEAGGLWAWGYNGSGQVGDGTTVSRNLPVSIQSGTTFKAVAAGGYCSFALDESGRLWGWGSSLAVNVTGYSDVKTPAIMSSAAVFETLIAGSHYALLIDAQQNLWAAGYDGKGALGLGSATSQKTPVQIKAGTKFKAAAAGYGISGGHSLALDTSGGLWAWGYNQNGQLGNGIEINQTSPIAVMPDTKFKAVGAAGDHSIFVDESGAVWACGRGYGATPVRIAQ